VSRFWRAAVIAVAVVAAYSNSLSGPFVLDDQASVVQNPDIRDLRRLGRVLSPLPDSPVAGRPLASLSFALDYAAGGLNVTEYHVQNLVWHLACAWLLFGIVRRTLDRPATRSRGGLAPQDLALAAALIWAVHPLTSEVVDYVTQRTESMMAFFLLLTVYGAIRSDDAPGSRWHAVPIVACLLGAGCKETIVVAPLLVVLYDRVFGYNSWARQWQERGRLYLGLAASWLVLGGFVLSGPRAAVGGLDAGVSPWTYLLNQAAIVAGYLRLSVWPARLVVFYGWPEPVAVTDVLPQAIFLSVLLVATLIGLLRAPRLGYLGAWFFLTLAPTSSILPIVTEAGAERRMYLPLMALVVLAVVTIDAVVTRLTGRVAHEKTARRRTALAVGLLFGLACVALGAATFRRTAEYASPVTLARTVVERRPTAVAHHILGEQLLLTGQRAEAETELQTAIRLGDSRARYRLGGLLFEARRFPEAAMEFEAYVATAGVPHRLRWLNPPVEEVLLSRLALAQIYAIERRWVDAAAQARLLLSVAPGHPDAQRVLGLALLAQQQWPEAIEVLRRYLALRSGDTQARVNLGVALVAVGRLDDAVGEFRRAVEGNPSDANARRMLDMALADQRAQGH